MPQLREQYQSLATLLSPERPRALLVDDTIGPNEGTLTNPVLLENHYADYGNPDDALPPWVRHPNSVSYNRCLGDYFTSTTGSSYTLYYFRRDPGTVDYRVEIDCRMSTVLPPGGNLTYVCARMDASQETFYYAAFSFVTDGLSFVIQLGKCVGGVIAALGSSYVLTGSDMPHPGEIWSLALDVSNDEKVAYLKKPTDTFYKRVLSSGNNEITAAGFGGVRMLRSSNSSGASPMAWRLRYNGPQLPGTSGSTGTPDPVQTPQLLWQPDYSVPSQSLILLGGVHVNSEPAPWKSEQEPFVRGVRQLDRMQIVAAADVPGSGPNKPPGGALRVELRKMHDGDYSVYATAAATATDLVLQMSAPDVASLFDRDFMTNQRTAEKVRVNGVPGVGTSVTVKRGQNTVAQPILSGDEFVVYCGDVSDSGNAYVTNRAEAYDRFATGGGDPPSTWPDPVGSIRYYRVLVYSDPSNSGWGQGQWTTLDQWKGQFGGSPPRALEVSSGSPTQYQLAGTRTRLGLGLINSGTWVKFVFGIRWDTSPMNGWVQVWRDDVLIIPKRYEATMDFKYNKPANGADPIYYKQGIYRTSAWEDTLIFYYGETKIGTTYADVA